MMMKCPVCDNGRAFVKDRPDLRILVQAVSCPACGEFEIMREVVEGLDDAEYEDKEIRRRLARYLYEMKGKHRVRITKQPAVVEGYDILDLETAHDLYREDADDPLEPYNGTLLILRARTRKLGQVFNSVDDRWLVPTMDDSEAEAILGGLFDEGYIKGSRAFDSDEFSLTSKGFEYAEQLAAKRNPPVAQHEPLSDGSPSLFLSHSHVDNDFAQQLGRDLEAQGVSVWCDDWDLDIGHNVTSRIQMGIAHSHFLAVVLSPSAVKSVWVEQEWSAAFQKELAERRVVVLPIMYQDCDLPPFLRTKKYADFRDQAKYKESLADLVRCVRGESKRPHR